MRRDFPLNKSAYQKRLTSECPTLSSDMDDKIDITDTFKVVLFTRSIDENFEFTRNYHPRDSEREPQRELKDDIKSFFQEEQSYAKYEWLKDTASVLDIAFFTTLLCHMNNLNVKRRGKRLFIEGIWAYLKGFNLKLNLFAG
ncbi:uncharacterized protein NPIL_219971 [Nephila pilipes]|uniref:Uncharacterized protein n=1 Tax=Nephila pilipes TaxID=299642 RepID=A0A8X6NCT8_NEPPI|nr:uncharacterized protein NPIL_219971 [Nephila pilipes]